MNSHETANVRVWGIHAGKTGDADPIFLKENRIALGWVEFGDLREVKPNREAFKQRLLEVRPDRKPGYYPIASGQVYRFAHEVKKGDLVIYSSKHERQIYIGEIVGDYAYVKDQPQGYPHQRAVKWLKDFPRTRFSQGALYETGSAMSFFQVKNYADEFMAALGNQDSPSLPASDETTTYVAGDIEQNTRDFVLKVLNQELKGHALAGFIAQLLEAMGYQTRTAPEGPDGGVDIIAHKDELGFEPPLIKVQVKSGEGAIGDPTVSQLYGKVEKSEFGMFVTLGTFTKQADSFARNKANLRLIDGDELVTLILDHYESFDSKYKGLLPLRRVYVPEPLEETE